MGRTLRSTIAIFAVAIIATSSSLFRQVPATELEQIIRRAGVPFEAWRIPEETVAGLCRTDTRDYFISEASVYRILRDFDLLGSLVYQVISASDSFKRLTKRVNEMWQTDFTYVKALG